MADVTILISSLVSAGIGIIGTWLTARNQFRSKQVEVVPPTLSIIMESWRAELERMQEKNAALEADVDRLRVDKHNLQEQIAALEMNVSHLEDMLKTLAAS